MALCRACNTAVVAFIGTDQSIKEEFAQAAGGLVWHSHNHTCTDTDDCPCTCEGGDVMAAVLAAPSDHGISDTATIDRSLLAS